MFSKELEEKAQALVDRYPVGRSALLPLLHLVQSQDGHVSDDGVGQIATLLGLTKAEVGAVSTFYTMYKREPMGRHLVSVCTNFSCKVRGAQDVYDRLSAKLDVGHNGTTADGVLTLEHAECLGNCEGAPVVSVDYLNYECLSPDDAEALVDRLIAGEVPVPTRGFPPPGIRALSHRLAGMGPLDPAVEGDLPSVVCTASSPRPSHSGEVATGAMADEHAGGGVKPAPDSPESEQRKAAANEAVAETGVSGDEVEGESGYSAREFPTTDADADPGTEYPSGDPRRQDQEHQDG